MEDSKAIETVAPREPSALEHWTDLLNQEFARESDRASVILAAALLDSALESLLKMRLAPAASRTDSLFGGANAPLGNFSARIELAHRIGLISSRFARDLHLIRKIRNDFAHNITGCTFEDSGVRSRVLELKRSAEKSLWNPEWRDNFAPGSKGDFEVAVAWMQWYLRGMCDVVEPFHHAPLEWGYLSREERSGV